MPDDPDTFYSHDPTPAHPRPRRELNRPVPATTPPRRSGRRCAQPDAPAHARPRAHTRSQPSAPLLPRWARWALTVEFGAILGVAAFGLLLHLAGVVLCLLLMWRYGDYMCAL